MYRFAYLLMAVLVVVDCASAATLQGIVVDHATRQPLAARVYIHNAAGEYFHVQCEQGKAVAYQRRRSDKSYEVHTTVSAHPFHVELTAGTYTVTVEKGKEYFPTFREFTITDDVDVAVTIPLRRWINMAARGWYSGETHVHRDVSELPTLQLAEDINVAFPLTAWVTDSVHTPAANNKNPQAVPTARLVEIDSTHVYWPVNTEYEIFTVRGKQHTLGAFFILNHREQFQLAAPPVGSIAAEARKQGGFLELDKHNWPWSMMLVPQIDVELFELANNHMWRTEFLYADWYPEHVGDYMNIEMVNGRFTERGWIDFGFQTYYALLNCGYKMQPTAGTASGVHPVPFGFGRVYVMVEAKFSYEKWVEGLLGGRSFVTTGPMLTASAELDEQGHIVVRGTLESPTEPLSIEIVANGNVVHVIDAQPERTESGALRASFESRIELNATTWVAVRAFTKRDGNRVSFAHTAPVQFDLPGKPLRPTRDQRKYLAKRVRDEITRCRGVVSDDALKEYESALRKFESIPIAD